MRRLLMAALLAHAPAALAAPATCPMADKSYTLKLDFQALKARFDFNKDCSEAIETYRGNTIRHKLTATERGWEYSSKTTRIVFNTTGRSAEIIGHDGRFMARMIPIR